MEQSDIDKMKEGREKGESVFLSQPSCDRVPLTKGNPWLATGLKGSASCLRKSGLLRYKLADPTPEFAASPGGSAYWLVPRRAQSSLA